MSDFIDFLKKNASNQPVKVAGEEEETKEEKKKKKKSKKEEPTITVNYVTSFHENCHNVYLCIGMLLSFVLFFDNMI